MIMVSRWAAKKELAPVLDPARRELKVIKAGTDLAAWGAGRLGYKDIAGDLKIFSIQLEGSINDVDGIVDKILNIDSARDVLTWNRSVINPSNWSLLKDEVRGQFDDTVKEAQPLLDSIVHAVAGALNF